MELERGSQFWLPAPSLDHLLQSPTQATQGRRPGQGARRFPPPYPLPHTHTHTQSQNNELISIYLLPVSHGVEQLE